MSGYAGRTVNQLTVLAAALVLLHCTFAAAAARPLSAHHVIVDGIPVAVWEKSPASPRRVVLLIHGRTWSARTDFDLQVPGEQLSLMDGLVAGDIAAYAVDLRGYGDTPRDPSGWLTPARAAADVIEVLDWIGRRHPDLPKPHLFGWSYGAMVAQLAAQQQPDKMSGLILFGYPVRPGIAVNPPNAGDAAPAVGNTAAAAAEDFITPGSISQKAIDAFVASALEHDPIRADWRGLPQWLGLQAAHITVPTLLMDAEHDPVSDDEVLLRLFRELGTSDKAWVVIPNSDHAAFLENPRDYFLKMMTAFILGQRVVEEVISADFLELELN